MSIMCILAMLALVTFLATFIDDRTSLSGLPIDLELDSKDS